MARDKKPKQMFTTREWVIRLEQDIERIKAEIARLQQAPASRQVQSDASSSH